MVQPATPIARRWPNAQVMATLHEDDTERVRASKLEALAAANLLSRAELLTLDLLSKGETPIEIALQLGVRISTIRTHIRHLFEKTGTNRMVELLQRLS